MLSKSKQKKLKNRFEDLDISQTDLAEILGVSRQHVNGILNAKLYDRKVIIKMHEIIQKETKRIKEIESFL